MATVRGHIHYVYGEPLADWEKEVALPEQPNAPYCPCPKCGAKQWVKGDLGYTCLTCGKEVYKENDGYCLRRYPYHDKDRGGVTQGYTAAKEHPQRKGQNTAVWGF